MLPSNDLCISYIPDLTSGPSPLLTQWPTATLALQGFLDTSSPPIRCLHLLLPEFEQTDLCIINPTYHSSLNLSFTPQKNSSPRLRGLPPLPLLCYVVVHRIFFSKTYQNLKLHLFIYLFSINLNRGQATLKHQPCLFSASLKSQGLEQLNNSCQSRHTESKFAQ